jgi:hypothetical protein
MYSDTRRTMMRSRLILVAIILTATALVAQTFRGTILGTVTDVTGAWVTGATVKVKNVDTGLERTTQTSGDGSYAIAELPIGNYTVTVTQSGFQTSITSAVAVNVATERRVDVVLKPGQVSEKIEVSGVGLPEVETTSDELGGVLTTATVADLPINGRDYTKLIFLNPGVAGSPDQITDSPGSFGEFSMNGARGRSNNYLLDGTDMNDGYRNDPAINQGGVFAVPSAILPIDAVAEMRVLSNFQPEYGRNAGATVNIVTKSGTDNFHGDVFEYFRNDALDARNYFNPSSQPRAPFHNNQFGGSLGGPIVKDKTFFFLDYEGQRESVGTVTLDCVPEPNRIAFDDAAIVAAGGTPNPVTAKILPFWPQPNLGTRPTPSDPNWARFDTGCPNGPNASLITPSYNNLSSFIAKIDQNFNQNNILTGRYFFGDSTQSFPLALTASGGQLPGFNTITPTRVQLVSISYVHTFGTTKVNEMRYGWNRFAEGFFPQDQSFEPSSIGLCAASSVAECTGPGPHNSGLPIILAAATPSGFSSFFAQPGTTSGDPRQRVDTNNQFVENFSWKINKHDLKMGFDFRRTSVEQYFDKQFRGRLKFSGLSAFLAGTPESGGFGSVQYSGNTRRHTAENGEGLYLQDSLRLTPRVTLNYGLRWDYYGVIYEKNHLFDNFVVNSFDPTTDTGTGSVVPVGTAGQPGLYKPDYKNFSPRASIAWDVTGKSKTVIRAGYGLFYDAFSQDMFIGHLPYPVFFDPGVAYANFGPNPITSAGLSPSSATITPGVPVYGQSNCGVVECDLFGADRNLKTPYMENYNLNLQQQLTNKMVLQVGYVGSQGHRLFQFVDLNQPTHAKITACDLGQTPDCPGPPMIHDFSVPRVFGGAGVGAVYIMQERSTAKSNYNSLQTSLRVTNWHNITSTANFVWSKSLDTASDGEDFVPNAAQPQDSNNPQLEYGPSNFNISKRFTWVFAYDLPKMSGGMQRLRNGWGFDSTVSLQSGQPFQLNYNAEDEFSGSAEGDDRPDVVGPIVYNYHNPANFLQLSSFAIPCTPTATALAAPSGFASDCTPGTRHFGNLGRNSLVGPTYKQWDVAIYKNTALTERLTMQLRAEFFNILNHPNFSSPLLPAFIADAWSPSGVFATRGNREVSTGSYPIVATGDVGIGNPFLGGGGPRGIQIAAKFTF